jgi:hypothetical protein
MRTRTAVRPTRAGITLTEILIGIMILGIGLISLATLFPIGLLRLREAQRQSRSAFLTESTMADISARNLLSRGSFGYADLLNTLINPANPPVWYPSTTTTPPNTVPNGYNPLIQDTGVYGPWVQYDPANASLAGGLWMSPPVGTPGYPRSVGGLPLTQSGLPFAYDPLWRFQTVPPGQTQPGFYLDPNNALGLNLPEARFASGNNPVGSTLRLELADQHLASAHGLQRLSNYNRPSFVNGLGVTVPLMASANQIPTTFVSPEDMVWNEIDQSGNSPSPVLPDLRISSVASANGPQPTPTQDWRFSWMITAQQNNTGNGASFDGNIVIFENRPFAYDATQLNPVAGETVVEGVFGAAVGNSVIPSANFANTGGYAAGADRSVLLRWFANQADPVVKVGDWIADVTYERSQMLVDSRFYFNGNDALPYQGAQNVLNNLEWDNLPAQRCFWYQVQRVSPAQPDPLLGPTYRSMTVYVNRNLEAKTLLTPGGVPVFQNAALICPYIVNVIPQSFFVR